MLGTAWTEPGAGSTVAELLLALNAAGFKLPAKGCLLDGNLKTNLLLNGNALQPYDARRIETAINNLAAKHPVQTIEVVLLKKPQIVSVDLL